MPPGSEFLKVETPVYTGVHWDRYGKEIHVPMHGHPQEITEPNEDTCAAPPLLLGSGADSDACSATDLPEC